MSYPYKLLKKGQPTVRLSTPTTRVCTRVVAVAVLHEYTALLEKVLVRNYTQRIASHPKHTIARVGVSSGSPISSRSMCISTSSVCRHRPRRFLRAGILLFISGHALVGFSSAEESSRCTSAVSIAAPSMPQAPMFFSVASGFVGASADVAPDSSEALACRGAMVIS